MKAERCCSAWYNAALAHFQTDGDLQAVWSALTWAVELGVLPVLSPVNSEVSSSSSKRTKLGEPTIPESRVWRALRTVEAAAKEMKFNPTNEEDLIVANRWVAGASDVIQLTVAVLQISDDSELVLHALSACTSVLNIWENWNRSAELILGGQGAIEMIHRMSHQLSEHRARANVLEAVQHATRGRDEAAMNCLEREKIASRGNYLPASYLAGALSFSNLRLNAMDDIQRYLGKCLQLQYRATDSAALIGRFMMFAVETSSGPVREDLLDMCSKHWEVVIRQNSDNTLSSGAMWCMARLAGLCGRWKQRFRWLSLLYHTTLHKSPINKSKKLPLPSLWIGVRSMARPCNVSSPWITYSILQAITYCKPDDEIAGILSEIAEMNPTIFMESNIPLPLWTLLKPHLPESICAALTGEGSPESPILRIQRITLLLDNVNLDTLEQAEASIQDALITIQACSNVSAYTQAILESIFLNYRSLVYVSKGDLANGLLEASVARMRLQDAAVMRSVYPEAVCIGILEMNLCVVRFMMGRIEDACIQWLKFRGFVVGANGSISRPSHESPDPLVSPQQVEHWSAVDFFCKEMLKRHRAAAGNRDEMIMD
uniref:Uncharacterized protein n=1 Tax=Compsopogon caeruleus TaxID=31354 RepID=A0A7S1TEP8_9RHOD